MKDYSQPDFYRFSEDSIMLVREANKRLLNYYVEKRPLRIIDLCSGCGVVGLEFLLGNSISIEKISFVEIQDEFIPHLKLNSNYFLKDRISLSSIEIINSHFNEVDGDYDVLLSNPPYFEMGKGVLPKSLEKTFCHFFNFNELDLFLERVISLLSDKGIAFIVHPLRSGLDKLLNEKIGIKFEVVELYSDVCVFIIHRLNID